MKLFLLLTILMLVVLNSFAEESAIDDLLTEINSLEGATQNSETRLMALSEHSDPAVSTSAKIRMATLYWQSGELESAERLLEGISQHYKDYTPEYKVRSLLAWANFELRRNNYPSAEKYARKASSVETSIHPPLVANTYSILGAALREQRKTLEAKQYFELALKKSKEVEDLSGIFNGFNSLGVMYRDSGDLASALNYLLQAREAVERYGAKGDRATVYYNLGDVFRDSSEPLKAIEYYQQALKLDIELGDVGNVAYDYTGIALAYSDLEHFEEALLYIESAIKQLLKVNAPQELSRAYLQQSRLYARLNDEAGKITSLTLAEKSASESNSQYQIMSVNIDKAEHSIEQQNYEVARDTLSGALEVANELSLDIDKLKINKLLAKTYKQLGDFKNAYSYMQASLELEQKLNSQDRLEKSERYKRDLNLLEEQLKVSRLEQTEEQQTQLIKAQKVENQRMYIIMIASLAVFIALAVLLLQRRKLAILRANLFEQALQQKQQLFADVSHELRTPLTVLKLQIQALQFDLVSNVEDSYEKLANKVNEINRLIADIYQLAQADTNSIDLNKRELDLGKLFHSWESDWQSTVESNGFTWHCNLELSGQRKYLDPMRIKQAIDNLLSNAISYTDKPGTISLQANAVNGQLVVSVEDTAPTVSSDNLKKIFTRLYRVDSSRSRQTGGSGLGLAICESLIKAHDGSIYAEQSRLGGLKVEFRI